MAMLQKNHLQYQHREYDINVKMIPMLPHVARVYRSDSIVENAYDFHELINHLIPAGILISYEEACNIMLLQTWTQSMGTVKA